MTYQGALTTEEIGQIIRNHWSVLSNCLGFFNFWEDGWECPAAFHKANKPQRDTQAPERGTGNDRQPQRVSLPYVEGLSDRLRKVFRQHSIQVYCKPTNSLRHALVHVKDKTPPEKRSHVIYGLKCPHSNCDKTYVGETLQAVKKRASQHRRPTQGDQPHSAFYTHLQESGHSFNFKDSDLVILDKEEHWFERGVRTFPAVF